MTDSINLPASIDETVGLLAAHDYVAQRGLATSVFLALSLRRPLLLEGETGTGKTELARVLSAALGRRLIRLQCHDGLDINSAVYEWDYARQIIEIRLAEVDGSVAREHIFDEKFLVERPLLKALRPQPGGAPILLIDELDRADEPFEAYLLELLDENQVTIPELGTIRAEEPPLVILTSNRTREIHDALKRRCLYAWLDYPDAETEQRILDLKAGTAVEALRRQIVNFVQLLRQERLFKRPGISESIDWARALSTLGVQSLDRESVEATLGSILKYQDDIELVSGEVVERLLGQA